MPPCCPDGSVKSFDCGTIRGKSFIPHAPAVPAAPAPKKCRCRRAPSAGLCIHRAPRLTPGFPSVLKTVAIAEGSRLAGGDFRELQRPANRGIGHVLEQDLNHPRAPEAEPPDDILRRSGVIRNKLGGLREERTAGILSRRSLSRHPPLTIPAVSPSPESSMRAPGFR